MTTSNTSDATTMPRIFSTFAVFPEEDGELVCGWFDESPESDGVSDGGVIVGVGDSAPDPPKGVDAGNVGLPPAAGLVGSSSPLLVGGGEVATGGPPGGLLPPANPPPLN